MEFLPADYVLGGVMLVMAVLGLFRGFSGTLAFFIAVGVAAVVAAFGWPFSASLTETTWMRAAGTLVATLVAFGIARLIVKKLVNGLLAQPSDAILGFLVGAAMGALVLLGWAYSGFHLEYSNLATEAAKYVGSVVPPASDPT